EGSLHILKTLLKHKVPPEAEDKDKRTPILWAASAGSSAACRVLVSAGADVNRADKDDLTALHCAASRGHSSCVETLVKNCKANVDPVDKNQCTPLFYATTLGYTDCVRSLLNLGADCGHTDTRGRTAAHCATVSGQTETLEILRRHKIDLWTRNLKGDLPLHEAAQAGHIDLVQYLLDHPPDKTSVVDAGNKDGRTCLHVASLTNNVWLCKVLIERRANVNAIMKNKGKYYSPYDVALIKGHSEAKDFLIQQGGRPASQVTSHAATTIQARYKYHKNKDRLRRKGKEKISNEQKEDIQSNKSSGSKEETEEKEKEGEETGRGIEEPEKEEEENQEEAVNGGTEKTLKKAPVPSPPTDSLSNKKEKEKELTEQEEKGSKDKTREPREKSKPRKVKSKGVNQEEEPLHAEETPGQTDTADPSVASHVNVTDNADTTNRPKSGKAVSKSTRTPRDTSSSPSPSPSPTARRNRRTPTSPKYVEKGTQITTGLTEVCINGETLDKTQIQGGNAQQTLEAQDSERPPAESNLPSSPATVTKDKQVLSSTNKVQSDKKKRTSRRESEKSQKSSRSVKTSSHESRAKSALKSVPSPESTAETVTQPKTPRSSHAEDGDSSKLVDSSELKQDPVPELKVNNKHKSEYSSDFESERSSRSSSSSSAHSATSDVDSSSSERVSRKKVKRSPARRSTGSRTRKTPSPRDRSLSSDAENHHINQREDQGLDKNSDKPVSKSHLKESQTTSKSSSDQIPSKKLSVSSSRSSKSSREQEEKLDGSTGQSSRLKPGDKDKLGSRDFKDDSSDMGFLFSKMKKPRRVQNGHKPSSKSDSEDDKENQNKNMAEDDQAYTDLEDMAEETAATTPRKRKTRPNKLIQAIQESVKRYERERQSIRQLHQVRRAQIYSGPTWDVALFRKIVEQHGSKQPGQGNQGDGTPNSASTTTAQTWEEYLKEQLKVIQEERKSASSTRKANSAPIRDSTTSATTGTKQTPRGSARRVGEPDSLDSRQRHHTSLESPGKQNPNGNNIGSQDDHVNSTTFNNTNAISDSNPNKTSTGRNPGGPTLRRAQTARGVRTAATGESHQETTTSPLDLSNHHSNPRWFHSREATRLRQELAQQQLIKAYRPSVGIEVFRNNSFAHHPSSRGWARPQSTMSTRTSASGYSLANSKAAQSRGASRESDYSTIMTTSGSRRVRTPAAQADVNTTQSMYARPRHPLIFKDPDEYDNPKLRKSEEQQAEI
ncbi:ankyrin repeat domain-containing protein, partial [Elysia marginata]